MSFIKVENLSKYYVEKNSIFSKSKEILHAVDGISFSLERGETLGLVGESGCGKTTLARLILRLEDSTEGKIFFKGNDITNLKGNNLKELRKNMQIIFQDSSSSLDPRQTLGSIISEPLKNFKIGTSKERMIKVKRIMDIVGLNPEYILRYPNEFSGGQCQRINIARALVLYPEFIVCDEPISSLDVSIQAQILNLLSDLKAQFELSYIFISHDLSAVSYISDKIAVMYLGTIVEIFNKNHLQKKQHHPYTKILLDAIPIIDPLCRNKWENMIKTELINSTIDINNACCFHMRCPNAKEICHIKKPIMKSVEEGSLVACHFL